MTAEHPPAENYCDKCDTQFNSEIGYATHDCWVTKDKIIGVGTTYTLQNPATSAPGEEELRQKYLNSDFPHAMTQKTFNEIYRSRDSEVKLLRTEVQELEVLLRRLLNKVNVVTCNHRLGETVFPGALEELSERQILIEEALARRGKK